MSRSIPAKIIAKYDTFNFSSVYVFLNPMPSTEYWRDYLPRFIKDEDNCPAQCLIDFHECMNQLGIYHENVLMKMFMISLEGDAC
jgi:hypothetical protein